MPLLALLLGAGLAGEPKIVEPDWAEGPTAGQVRAYFPDAAVARDVSGRGMVKCGVTARGRLTGCVIKSETPPGWGFGEAALRLTPSFRMRPQTKDGRPTSEGSVTIPVNFWVQGTVQLECGLVAGRARGCVAIDEKPADRGLGATAAAFAEGRKPGSNGTSVRQGKLRWRLDTPVPIPECAAGETKFPCGGPDS